MSEKLNHLQQLIIRINDKYTLTDQEKIKKNFKYLKNNYLFITFRDLNDLLHDKKLEKKLWKNLCNEESCTKIIVIRDSNIIKYVGYISKEIEETISVTVDNEKIKINNKNSYLLLLNKDCKNEVSIEKSIYEFNKLLNKAEYSEINITEIL